MVYEFIDRIRIFLEYKELIELLERFMGVLLLFLLSIIFFSFLMRMLFFKCKLIFLIKFDIFGYVFLELRLIKILGKFYFF